MADKKFVNLINPHDVDSYLKKFCGDDERLQMLLITALARIIKKSPDCMETIREMPENAPVWLRDKWQAHAQWHRFEPRKYRLLAGTVYQVTGWLQSAIEHDLEWLHNVDERGRPKKLLKFSSFKQVYEQIDADKSIIKRRERTKARAALKDETEGVDILEVMTFADGHRFVRLLSERALDREGAYLEHCIGEGGYDQFLHGDTYFCYSLRAPDNTPCVTMCVDVKYRYLYSLSGPKNSLPNMKYIPYVATYCHEYWVDMSGGLCMKEEEYKKPVQQDLKFFRRDMAETRTGGDLPALHFRDMGQKVVIPDGQKVSYLYISDVGNMDVFPRNVEVHGDIFFYGQTFPAQKPEGWIVTGIINTGTHRFDTWEGFLAHYYP